MRPGSRHQLPGLVLCSAPSVVSMGRGSEIERLFTRGRYADVIAQSVDRRDFDPRAESSLGHIVAALAASGRLDDADALLARAAALASARELGVARFFLAVARCRAGQFARAQPLFIENLCSWRQQRDARELEFFALQGLCCLRYFTGRMRRAELLARRALKAAFAADYPLGRLLATDLQGHAWVQMGQVKRGLALLQRAQELAEAFELDAQRGAIEFARMIYEARFGTQGLRVALAQLEALHGEQVHDSYSARLAAIDRALLLAFAGRSDEAQTLLHQVDGQLIPEGDRRMQIRLLLAAAIVSALRDSEEAARRLVAEAEARLDDDADGALRVEVLCVKAWCVLPQERRALARELERAARDTAIARASLYAHLLEPSLQLPASVSLRDFEDDRLGALLLSVLHDHQLPRLIREHHFGLVPRALGLPPGRRIYLIEPSRILVESHGNVSFARPGETSVRLLRALADGRWWSKQALLSAVWGIGSYRPDRHDPVVYMAVTRARQALGSYRDWLENEQGAYRLSGAECRVLPWRDEVHSLDAHAAPLPEEPLESVVPDAPAALSFVRQHGHATTGRLAKALRVSEMTALRELQKLVASGVLRRIGRGRSTRYELNEV